MNTKAMKLERAHDAALEQHDRRWYEMHRLGITDGHDSPAYAEARQSMLEAHREVKRAARAKRKRP